MFDLHFHLQLKWLSLVVNNRIVKVQTCCFIGEFEMVQVFIYMINRYKENWLTLVHKHRCFSFLFFLSFFVSTCIISTSWCCFIYILKEYIEISIYTLSWNYALLVISLLSHCCSQFQFSPSTWICCTYGWKILVLSWNLYKQWTNILQICSLCSY